MSVYFRSIFFVSISVLSVAVDGGECEKETNRKSIQCLEKKIDKQSGKLETLEKKLRLLEGNMDTQSIKFPAQSEIKSHRNILGKNIENGDYTFQFEQCKKTNKKNEIICTFYVTNNTDEHIVGISVDWARLFLTSGSSSAASEIYLGNIGGASKSHMTIDYTFSFPSSVPIRGKALYKDMEGDAISLFQFKISPNRNTNNTVAADFKNIPLISGL
jgi:hypothetical protein